MQPARHALVSEQEEGTVNCQLIESFSAKIKFSIFYSETLKCILNRFERLCASVWSLMVTEKKREAQLKILRPLVAKNISLQHNGYFLLFDKVHRHWLCTELKLFGCILMRISMEGPAVSSGLCICSILHNPPPLLSNSWILQSHAAGWCSAFIVNSGIWLALL